MKFRKKNEVNPFIFRSVHLKNVLKQAVFVYVPPSEVPSWPPYFDLFHVDGCK